MTTYTPHPRDTTTVALPAGITALTEQLAENAHEVWAAERIAQGWTHGARRDDVARCHPCLVPYAELSEAEKTFDRATALQTLRLILALGYTIVSPPA
jgi:ryanodine receptor 2